VAELFHPYYEFSQKRYDITIASPEGGQVTVDACPIRATHRNGALTT
jgi:putative intracellular protease/amidase